MKVSINVVRRSRPSMPAELIKNAIPMPTKYYTTKVSHFSRRSSGLHTLNLRFCPIKFPPHFCKRLTLRLIIRSTHTRRKTSWVALQVGAWTESGSSKRRGLERLYETSSMRAGSILETSKDEFSRLRVSEESVDFIRSHGSHLERA